MVYSAVKSSNPQAQIETIRIPVYNATIDLADGNAILQRAGKPPPALPCGHLTEFADTAMTLAPTLIKLDTLPTGSSGTVVHVAPGDPADDGADLARRLMELGFVPGEKIRLLKRGMPGGEPLAIKVGNSTFALRRFEAALISIQPE